MENQMNSARKFRIGRLAGMVGIGVNLILFTVKLIAGLLIGSMAMVADAVNNVTDAASSILVLLGYVFAAKPADRKHPYGHARMEHLCSLMISILVTILGIELFTSSLDTLRKGDGGGAVFSPIAVGIMGFSIAVKIALAIFYRQLGKRIDSASLRASAMDSIGDVCATCAVIVGMLLTPILGAKTDAVLGMLIATYIFIMGVRLIVDGVNILLGEAPDVELVRKIVAKLKSYDGVLGIHDLVIHNYGVDKYFATVHVEMDAERDIFEAHERIDQMEADMSRDMGIQLVIHLDPICLSDERINHLRAEVQSITSEVASEYSSPLSMHDFRAVFGPNRTNLIFDIAAADDMPLTNEELVETLRAEIRKRCGENYHAAITIDRDYTSNRY